MSGIDPLLQHDPGPGLIQAVVDLQALVMTPAGQGPGRVGGMPLAEIQLFQEVDVADLCPGQTAALDDGEQPAGGRAVGIDATPLGGIQERTAPGGLIPEGQQPQGQARNVFQDAAGVPGQEGGAGEVQRPAQPQDVIGFQDDGRPLAALIETGQAGVAVDTGPVDD